jgi:hypothetical protein
MLGMQAAVHLDFHCENLQAGEHHGIQAKLGREAAWQEAHRRSLAMVVFCSAVRKMTVTG